MATSKVARAQSRSKRGKQPARRTPKRGTTVADRQLLTQAERQDIEGKAARDYLDRLRVALENAAPKPQPIATPTSAEVCAMLASELRGVVESLGEALGDIIEAHMEEDTEAFGFALRRVNSARVVLQGEASKLEAAQ